MVRRLAPGTGARAALPAPRLPVEPGEELPALAATASAGAGSAASAAAAAGGRPSPAAAVPRDACGGTEVGACAREGKA